MTWVEVWNWTEGWGWGLRDAPARANSSGSGSSIKCVSLVLLEIDHSYWPYQDFITSEKIAQANCWVTHFSWDGSPNSAGQRTLEPQCRAEQLQLSHLQALICFSHHIICFNHCWHREAVVPVGCGSRESHHFLHSQFLHGHFNCLNY